MVYALIKVVDTQRVLFRSCAAAETIHLYAPVTDHIEPHGSAVADAVNKQTDHHQQNRTITKQARPQNAHPATRNGIFGGKTNQTAGITYSIHNVVTGIHAQAAVDALGMQHIANIELHRAHLHTPLAFNAITHAIVAKYLTALMWYTW